MEQTDTISQPHVGRSRYFGMFDKISNFVFKLVLTLLPVLFIPINGLPIDMGKKFILIWGVLLVAILWFLARLEDGTIRIPKSYLMLSAALLPLVYFVSSLFAESQFFALFGYGHESGTFISVLIFFFVFLFGAIYYRGKESIQWYLYLLVLGFLLFLFQLGHLIFPAQLSASFIRIPTDNLVGKWNDLGIIFGLMNLVSLLFLELIPVGFMARIVVSLSFAASLVGLLLVNFGIVWLALAFFSLVVLVYRFLSRDEGQSLMEKIVRPSLLTLLVAVLLFLSGTGDGFLAPFLGNIQSKLGISTLEARPSFETTLSIGKIILKDHALVGVGPNYFERYWRLYKPQSVYETPFWNSDFSLGYGYIPTALVTVGILGALAWILFLACLIFFGARGMLMTLQDPSAFRLVLLSYFSSLFLWVLAIFYVPDTLVLALAFLVSGFLLSSLVDAGVVSPLEFTFGDVPRRRFASVLVLVLFVIGLLTLGYIGVQKLLALRNFQNGFLAVNVEGNLDKAFVKLNSAVKLDARDLYYRSLADLAILKMNRVLGQGGVPADQIRQQFQETLSNAILYANEAIKIDNKNPYNYITLGRVYESIIPLKIEGAYEAATQAYANATSLNTNSPLPYLHYARLEFTRGDTAKARQAVSAAIERKKNFTEAFFLLSQIESKDGNVVAAIQSSERVAQLAPGDIGVLFQLGLLRYMNKEYKEAIGTLERAVALNANYSNARYFLGLSYDKIGETEKAIENFEKIKLLNPDNDEVKKILRNLQSGRSALIGISPPAEAPERRNTPPVRDDR